MFSQARSKELHKFRHFDAIQEFKDRVKFYILLNSNRNKYCVYKQINSFLGKNNFCGTNRIEAKNQS
jgi:hypothetical protein